MDHLGAAFGQLLAFGLVAIGLSVRHTFGVASMLGLLAPLLLLLRLRDPRTSAEPAAPVAAPAPTPAMAAPVAATQPGTLRRGFAPYLTVCVLFALGNSSDAFILVRAHELGWQNTTLPLLWFVHHLVKSVVAIPGGALSDRHSRAMVVTGGWAAYALVYVGFAFATAGWQILVLVLLYALYHGLAEGPERAIIADLAEPGARGRAYGLYYGYVGFAALPAGLGTGWIWQHWGPRWALGLNAGFAALAALSLAAIAFGGSLRRRR
jgi:MFS family permease